MYKMPLIYVFGFGGWGFGVGASIFCIGVLDNGVLSLALCPEITQALIVIQNTGNREPKFQFPI